MNLSDWLTKTKTRRYEFAQRIGVQPSVVTDYCKGTIRPRPDKMEAIVRETGGEVGADDFLSDESRALIAAADAAAGAAQ
jgi:DNA-binding transcriptional regulator YdaS (Cro superfamily)